MATLVEQHRKRADEAVVAERKKIAAELEREAERLEGGPGNRQSFKVAAMALRSAAVSLAVTREVIVDGGAGIGRHAPPSDQGYIHECEDCECRAFWLVRRHGCIRFKCTNCGSEYIDDEGFGRP